MTATQAEGGTARPALGLRRFDIPVAAGVAALLLIAALGVYVGLRTPWGTKHPQVTEGIAMRANSENDVVMFDAEDGTQFTLHANGLWWESNSGGGEGDPPCLQQPGEKSNVEVGYLKVAGPEGGSRTQVMWVKCL